MPKIELLPVSALRPALYNPREADAERLELVRLSLRKLGFLLPLVATTDGEILSGHQRHAVAVDMGAARVPRAARGRAGRTAARHQYPVQPGHQRPNRAGYRTGHGRGPTRGGCSFPGRETAGHCPGQSGVLFVYEC